MYLDYHFQKVSSIGLGWRYWSALGSLSDNILLSGMASGGMRMCYSDKKRGRLYDTHPLLTMNNHVMAMVLIGCLLVGAGQGLAYWVLSSQGVARSWAAELFNAFSLLGLVAGFLFTGDDWLSARGRLRPMFLKRILPDDREAGNTDIKGSVGQLVVLISPVTTHERRWVMALVVANALASISLFAGLGTLDAKLSGPGILYAIAITGIGVCFTMLGAGELGYVREAYNQWEEALSEWEEDDYKQVELSWVLRHN